MRIQGDIMMLYNIKNNKDVLIEFNEVPLFFNYDSILELPNIF